MNASFWKGQLEEKNKKNKINKRKEQAPNQQSKLKDFMKSEIIKIKVEINGIENRKTVDLFPKSKL